ncbi:MAG: hypothetical protein KAJ95_05495 [Gammaproteobacteria bacterium]|nr:hypothetical protein [Gammaproteobacteria bacterium]
MASKKEPAVEDMSSDEQEYLERTALLGLEYVLADFAREFQAATRRWEKLVWPAMVIFSLLAISGFWLIYSITEDMHRMSTSMDPQMSENLGSMSRNIETLTSNIENMDLNISLLTDSINEMSFHIAHMDGSMSAMQKDISGMSYNISNMNQSINAMTYNTGAMSEDMNRLNRNIGKPMRFMNNFIP